MLLRPEHRTKIDTTEDEYFYSFPRFVTHVDDNFIKTLTNLYRTKLKPNMKILDLMSSWVSHLPDEIKFSHIEGHGMNEEELQKNPKLDHYFIQNLNKNPQFPLADQEFDAVLIAVSIQYLQYPEAILSEIHRILKPDGIVIISFSNRMFYQKAITAWRDNNEETRVKLVEYYLKSIEGFSQPEIIIKPSNLPSFLQMLGISGTDPFYALISRKTSF